MSVLKEDIKIGETYKSNGTIEVEFVNNYVVVGGKNTYELEYFCANFTHVPPERKKIALYMSWCLNGDVRICDENGCARNGSSINQLKENRDTKPYCYIYADTGERCREGE